MIESSKKLKPWRQSVVYAATEATGGKALRLDSAMALHVEFLMPRPKKPKSLWPCRTPDLSKLVRGVEDALQDAGVITDDARFVDIVATKRYVLGHSQAGAMITIYKLHVD
jgi:crossover junction endodeoxyribonuclease RusA